MNKVVVNTTIDNTVAAVSANLRGHRTNDEP